jgi:hypothetical protein
VATTRLAVGRTGGGGLLDPTGRTGGDVVLMSDDLGTTDEE